MEDVDFFHRGGRQLPSAENGTSVAEFVQSERTHRLQIDWNRNSHIANRARSHSDQFIGRIPISTCCNQLHSPLTHD